MQVKSIKLVSDYPEEIKGSERSTDGGPKSQSSSMCSSHVSMVSGEHFDCISPLILDIIYNHTSPPDKIIMIKSTVTSDLLVRLLLFLFNGLIVINLTVKPG